MSRVATKVEKSSGGLSILDEMAATSTKGKKSHSPVVRNSGLNSLIDQYEAACSEIDKYESIKASVGDQLIQSGLAMRTEECRRLGRVEPTITINGRINLTQKSQYGKIPEEALPQLQEAFGKDAAVYFPIQWEISLTDTAAADESIIAEIIKLVGADKFRSWFKASKRITVSEAFHNDLTLKPAVEKKAQPFLDHQIIKPYKPTLR